ncbi:MAG TPA: saccharopine dehydrogenase NADP-binding domain-containing protein [Propionicimonas sp.]|nr:saccharopine dehydrogenase NADP-binding domain-containing protein [Propionicimonas sp.]
MRIVLLGASGNAGREIARLLSPSLGAGDQLVLAGRDPGRLAATAAVVSGPAAVLIEQVDATVDEEVRRLVAGATLVVVTASVPERIGALARMVAEAGADWMDTLLSSPAKLAALRALEPELRANGCCFVTDGGFHPGLPAAMVRWAGGRLDDLETADVYGGMRLDWRAETLAGSTVAEMLHEFDHFDLVTWIDGTNRKLKMSECPKVDFGPPIGAKTCVPMPLAEMDLLPKLYPTLNRSGFYIAGFSPAMDYVALPILMAMLKVPALHPLAARFTRWSFRRLASYPPPHRMVLRLDATGLLDGSPATASIEVAGDDGYFMTAAPVVACLRRLLDGSVRLPGLWLQAHVVPAETYFADLADLGLAVTTELRTTRTAD